MIGGPLLYGFWPDLTGQRQQSRRARIRAILMFAVVMSLPVWLAIIGLLETRFNEILGVLLLLAVLALADGILL